jgi:hypothetical protein
VQISVSAVLPVVQSCVSKVSIIPTIQSRTCLTSHAQTTPTRDNIIIYDQLTLNLLDGTLYITKIKLTNVEI